MATVEQCLEDLLGPGRFLSDRDALLAYECDGFTVHKSPPRAVALPRTTAETARVVALLHEHRVPFLPRGAGTCLSGGATPAAGAIIIETALMKDILQVDAVDLFAVVQPGVVNLDLTAHVQDQHLHYAPDPSSQSVCTIGGNLAENSGGPHCFKRGMTTDHVLGAVVVLPDGSIARLGDPAGPRPMGCLDTVALFTGSEGTFGIATEITVRLTPDPESIRTLLASFAAMEDACAAVGDIVGAGLVPSAMEVLDRATIAAVEASVYAAGYPTDAAAVLLVELDGPDDDIAREAGEVRSFLAEHKALEVEEATDAAERQRLWKGRKGAFGAMGRLAPDLYVLDGVVPRSRLVETLQGITAIGEKHQLTLSNVFHAGDGNLHPNISFDGRDPEETARVLAAGHEILSLCMAMGGSISGEHGIGSEKLEHMSMMFDEGDVEVMERVHRAFNPSGLCNPGKVLPERSSCVEAARRPEVIDRVLHGDGNTP